MSDFCFQATVHSKCINDHIIRSDIFLPKCPTNLRVNTLYTNGVTRNYCTILWLWLCIKRLLCPSVTNNDLGATFPGRSDIFLPKCPTNLRVNTLYLVGHFGLGRTWEWILKDFFLHFSRWICQTFCDRCVFVSVLSFRCVKCAHLVCTVVSDPFIHFANK
jgi:hypothetical protein